MSNMISNLIPYPSTEPKELPSLLTYSRNGQLEGIEYPSGSQRLLSYNPDGSLSTSTYIVGNSTTIKTFNYNLDGTLASVI